MIQNEAMENWRLSWSTCKEAKSVVLQLSSHKIWIIIMKLDDQTIKVKTIKNSNIMCMLLNIIPFLEGTKVSLGIKNRGIFYYSYAKTIKDSKIMWDRRFLFIIPFLLSFWSLEGIHQWCHPSMFVLNEA